MTELFVDNFAGGGGASTGIELAIGRSVDIAVNHDPDAIAMHRANHPTVTWQKSRNFGGVSTVNACMTPGRKPQNVPLPISVPKRGCLAETS